MDNPRTASHLGSEFFWVIFYQFFTRWQIRRAKKLGEDIFENVAIRVDPRRNAITIAVVTTVFASPVMAFVAIFFTLYFLPESLRTFNFISVIFYAIILCISLAVYFSIVYLRSRWLQIPATYNYSGLGLADLMAYKNYLIASRNKIKGIISLKWKYIQITEKTSDTSIKLQTTRRPKWIYDLFHLNVVEIVFSSADDRNKFENILEKRSILLSSTSFKN